MINRPSLDQLIDNVDSVYTLVILASKRARQINAGSDTLLDEEEFDNNKIVSRSLKELSEGKIDYRKNNHNTIK